MRTFQDMKELKEICCSEGDRVQESRTDEFSRDELRRSQSTVNQLTVRIHKLQDRKNCLKDSRDLQNLETASTSGSLHVLGHDPIVPSFLGCLDRDF